MAADPRAGVREIDHTADLGIEIWAPEWPALVRVATEGIARLCYDLDAVVARQRRSIVASGADREALLVDWLLAVYLALETDGFLTARVESLETSAGRLEGVLVGEPFDGDRHTIHTEIKAITYHRLHVERGADGLLRTRVIVDV